MHIEGRRFGRASYGAATKPNILAASASPGSVSQCRLLAFWHRLLHSSSPLMNAPEAVRARFRGGRKGPVEEEGLASSIAPEQVSDRTRGATGGASTAAVAMDEAAVGGVSTELTGAVASAGAADAKGDASAATEEEETELAPESILLRMLPTGLLTECIPLVAK